MLSSDRAEDPGNSIPDEVGDCLCQNHSLASMHVHNNGRALMHTHFEGLRKIIHAEVMWKCPQGPCVHKLPPTMAAADRLCGKSRDCSGSHLAQHSSTHKKYTLLQNLRHPVRNDDSTTPERARRPGIEGPGWFQLQ